MKTLHMQSVLLERGCCRYVKVMKYCEGFGQGIAWNEHNYHIMKTNY